MIEGDTNCIYKQVSGAKTPSGFTFGLNLFLFVYCTLREAYLEGMRVIKLRSEGCDILVRIKSRTEKDASWFSSSCVNIYHTKKKTE